MEDWLNVLRKLQNSGSIVDPGGLASSDGTSPRAPGWASRVNPVQDLSSRAAQFAKRFSIPTPTDAASQARLIAAGEQFAREAEIQAGINARGSAPAFRKTFPALAEGLQSLPPWLKTAGRIAGPAGMAVTLATAPRYDDRDPDTGAPVGPARLDANQLLGRSSGTPLSSAQNLPVGLVASGGVMGGQDTPWGVSVGDRVVPVAVSPNSGTDSSEVWGASVGDRAPSNKPSLDQQIADMHKRLGLNAAGDALLENPPSPSGTTVSSGFDLSKTLNDLLGRAPPILTAPNRLSTYTANTANLRYPDLEAVRPSSYDVGLAAMKAGAGMLANAREGAGAAIGRGLGDATTVLGSAREAAQRNALAKYGVDLTQAGKLTDLASADTADLNTQRLASFMAPLDAARAVGPTIAGLDRNAVFERARANTTEVQARNERRQELKDAMDAARRDPALQARLLQKLRRDDPEAARVQDEMQKRDFERTQHDALMKAAVDIAKTDTNYITNPETRRQLQMFLFSMGLPPDQYLRFEAELKEKLKK